MTFLSVYFLILYHSLLHASALEIVLSQTFAKFSMLLMLTTSKPSYEGMGAYFMEFAKKRDLAIGAIPLILTLHQPVAFIPLTFSVFITLCLELYANSRLGGVSGDVIGASNCLTFASSLLVFSLLN